MSPACVLYVCSPNWVGAARFPKILKAAGCHVDLLAPRFSFAGLSRHIDRRIPGARDPGANVERLGTLLSDGAAYDWIILADDPTFVEAARHCSEDWIGSWFPVDPRSAKPSWLANKARFMEEAGKAGLPVPASRGVSTAAEALEAAGEIGYPVIVKPVSGSAGTGIVRAASEGELERLMPREGEFILQSFVEGRVGATSILCDRGQVLWWMSTIGENRWPEPFGPASSRRRVNLPQIERVVRRLAAWLDLRGVCEIDWVMPDREPEPLILELNPRPPSYLYLSDRLGAGLSAAIAAFLAKEPATVSLPRPAPEETVALFPEDLLRAVSRRDWRRCRRWLTASAGPLPWDDPLLFCAYALMILKAAKRSVLRSLHPHQPRTGKDWENRGEKGTS